MIPIRHTTSSNPLSLEGKLEQLLAVLESERKALLDGDARTVAALASEKDELASAIRDDDRHRGLGADPKEEIIALAARIAEIASTNHLLLTQMYQHYQGMLDLLSRLAGRGTTYGRNGFWELSFESSSSPRMKV